MRYVIATIVLVAAIVVITQVLRPSRSDPPIVDLLPIDDDLALVAHERSIERVDRVGNVRWRFDLPAPFVRFVAADRTAIVRVATGLLALDADNAELRWTQLLASIEPAGSVFDLVAGEHVVTIAAGELRGTDLRTGGIVWIKTKRIDPPSEIDATNGMDCKVLSGLEHPSCVRLEEPPPRQHRKTINRTIWSWPPVEASERR